MKQTLLIFLFFFSAQTHMTYPGGRSPYGTQQGLFLGQISKVQHSDTEDVVYIRFCKAICMLYVPEDMTCGYNNQVYLNDCQAKCDRIDTDKSRLMFNNKCCCSPGTEYVDSAWVRGDNLPASSDPTIKSASFCVSIKPSNTSVISGNINIFAIPPCLASCLGINDKNDLKYVDNSIVTFNECDDGISN